ncbi:MAG: hypothetical protein WC960_03475 [Bacteroidales bacterium]
MKLRLIFAAALLLVVSCKYIDFIGNDQVIAEIGGRRLLRSEIESVIPEGIAPQDSIAMFRQYVNSWVVNNLLIHRAESELPKGAKDFDRAVEEYRNSLMVYSYEKLYIESKIDTTVTDSEALDYYHRNGHRMTLTNSIVKGRYIKILQNSPNTPLIKKLYRKEGEKNFQELMELCHNSSEKYLFFDNWRELGEIVRESPLDLHSAEIILKGKQYIELDDALYTYLLYFSEVRPAATTPPFEFVEVQIKEAIIEKRKQQLLRDLEKEILAEALEKNLIKTNLQ